MEAYAPEQPTRRLRTRKCAVMHPRERALDSTKSVLGPPGGRRLLAARLGSISPPQRADGDGEDAFAEAQQAGAGVEYRPGHEPVAELAAQPF